MSVLSRVWHSRMRQYWAVYCSFMAAPDSAEQPTLQIFTADSTAAYPLSEPSGCVPFRAQQAQSTYAHALQSRDIERGSGDLRLLLGLRDLERRLPRLTPPIRDHTRPYATIRDHTLAQYRPHP
eukprot:2128568-Rhodomonas_salina.1